MNKSNFTAATTVTCVRIALVPMFLYAATVDMRVALGLFLLASLSDWLDGYLARKLSCQSELGALLDPLADKAMSWAALVVINQSVHHAYLLLASVCIVARDTYLSAHRVYCYLKKTYPQQLNVSSLAKAKTALLFFSQLLLTFYIHAQIELVYAIGIVLLYAACLLTLVSFASYYLRTKEIEL